MVPKGSATRIMGRRSRKFCLVGPGVRVVNAAGPKPGSPGRPAV